MSMSCRDICCLLCCPPLPSSIAAKLAFLPPEPTYSIVGSDNHTPGAGDTSSKNKQTYSLVLGENSGVLESDNEKLEVFMARTRCNQRIACLYVHMNRDTKTTILLSHGNAVDLGLMAAFMLCLSAKLCVNVMSYDYSGYGMSTGRPSETNLYADAECALEELMRRFNVPLEQVILYGQSIGTAPTVEIATRFNAGLVVLHSPLLSGLQVACPGTSLFSCCDVFKNKDKITQITSPTLIIHGTLDEVIDFHHGQTLFEKLVNPLEPLFINGAGHNDCELYPQYIHGLRKLINPGLTQLAAIVQPTSASSTPPTLPTTANGASNDRGNTT